MKYALLVLAVFALTGVLYASSERSHPRHALPTICKGFPVNQENRESTWEPNRCWDGRKYVYLMDGWEVVELEGGYYLVGWPK